MIVKKVFVGLSGGVDSAVSALLLKQQGYEVVGVFIKGWQPDWIACTWKDDRLSALRSAAHLDIPFITLDLEQTYKNKVVNYILEEYAKGNTPNPDMLCNREIKFGAFLKWAIQNGADFVATGHYAQNINNNLFESNDKEKDQSYFLSQLSKKELEKTLFPIGHLQKSEVRKIAKENNLPVATRKDSQGICFVGDLEMKDFLKRELKPQKGKVLNENGDEIGQHDGAILYTIGERHGFKIFKNENNTKDNIEQHYIIAKDINKNILFVSTKINSLENYKLNSKKENIKVKHISFTNSFNDINNSDIENNLSIRVRYRGIKYFVKILNFNQQENILDLELDLEKNKESDVENFSFAAGQFAVFYDGEKCLGGGELFQ